MHGIPIGNLDQSSEIDSLLRMKAISNGGMVRNDNRHLLDSWEEFGRLLTLASICDSNTLGRILKTRSEKTNSKPVLLRTIVHKSGKICMKEYRLNN